MFGMRVRIALSTALLWVVVLVAPASGEELKVPINIGVGPAFLHFSGAVGSDQTWHTGIELDLAAVIDQETIRKQQHRIPRQYRALAKQVKEIKVGYIFVPDMLIISPQYDGRNTGMYGATWRPLSPGISFGGDVKLLVSAGVLLTYLYMHSDTLSDTHFLRPGLDGRAELTWRISDSWLLSGGWSSGFYIPQKLGGFGLGDAPDNIWHIGRGYGLLHYRLPYAVNIP